MKLLSTILVAVLLEGSRAADPTWPSPIIDEMEDIMYLTSGYRNRGFASAVTPCNKPPAGATTSRTTSAEWIRTAFHDAAPGNVYFGTGGMDASIMFELADSVNAGPAFTSTLQFMANYYNTRASAADLLSLALYTSTRACGGPVVPIRVGRLDATERGPAGGVPEPQNAVGTFVNQFGRLGFSPQDMIAVIACGHTVGGKRNIHPPIFVSSAHCSQGVHSAQFPTIVAPGPGGSDVYTFVDSTPTVFDNQLITEYLDGKTTDPMSVGICASSKRCSDAVVYNYDKNATLRTLANPTTFASTCANVFQRMIEVVPSATTLSTDPISPYEVKPTDLKLTLLSGGTQLSFSGEIRVRTTVRAQSQIASVQLNYVDRNGGNACGNCVIMTSAAGTANGFDDSFTFYSFSATLDAITTISSFNVLVNLVGGTSEMHDNNGVGYPVQDSIMVQTPQSCLINGNFTVVAAVRNNIQAASLDVTLQQARAGIIIPALVTQSQPMVRGSMYGPYSLFSASYALPADQSTTAKFGVSTADGTAADSFRNSGDVGTTCLLLAGSSASSSSSSLVSTAGSTSTSSTLPSPSTLTTSPSVSSTSSIPSTLSAVYSTASSSSTNPDSSRSSLSTSASFTQSTTLSTVTSSSSSSRTSSVSITSSSSTSLSSASSTSLSSSSNSLATSSASSSSTSTSSSSISVKPSTSSITITSPSTGMTSKTSTSPSTASATSGWIRLGCYIDSTSARTLKNGIAGAGGTANMTIGNCQASAKFAGYQFAGLEYGQECWAANAITNGGALASDGETYCNMPCNGNSAEVCGGSNRLNMFVFVSASSESTTATLSATSTSTVRSTTTATSTSTASTPTSTIPTVQGWVALGCYTDSTAGRTLGSSLSVLGGASNMTNYNCQIAAKAAGYAYAATEYSGECWAGPKLNNGGGLASDGNTYCNMACNGNKQEVCGGSNRLTMYYFSGSGTQSTASSSTTTPAATKSTSISSAQASTTAASGWRYVACYTDPVNPRALPVSLNVLGGPSNMTNYNCQVAAKASGYTLVGTEYSGECWAGSMFGTGSGPASDGDNSCNMACRGGSGSEMCGGSSRLSVWSFGNFTA